MKNNESSKEKQEKLLMLWKNEGKNSLDELMHGLMVQDWILAGFGPDDYRLWTRAGCSDPNSARQMESVGVSAEIAGIRYINSPDSIAFKFSSNDISLSEAIDAAYYGVCEASHKEAAYLLQVGISPQDLYECRYGDNNERVRELIRLGVMSLTRAREIIKTARKTKKDLERENNRDNISENAIAECTKSGEKEIKHPMDRLYNDLLVQDWILAGFTPQERQEWVRSCVSHPAKARELLDNGITPEIAAIPYPHSIMSIGSKFSSGTITIQQAIEGALLKFGIPNNPETIDALFQCGLTPAHLVLKDPETGLTYAKLLACGKKSIQDIAFILRDRGIPSMPESIETVDPVKPAKKFLNFNEAFFTFLEIDSFDVSRLAILATQKKEKYYLVLCESGYYTHGTDAELCARGFNDDRPYTGRLQIPAPSDEEFNLDSVMKCNFERVLAAIQADYTSLLHDELIALGHEDLLSKWMNHPMFAKHLLWIPIKTREYTTIPELNEKNNLDTFTISDWILAGLTPSECLMWLQIGCDNPDFCGMMQYIHRIDPASKVAGLRTTNNVLRQIRVNRNFPILHHVCKGDITLKEYFALPEVDKALSLDLNRDLNREE